MDKPYMVAEPNQYQDLGIEAEFVYVVRRAGGSRPIVFDDAIEACEWLTYLTDEHSPSDPGLVTK